jgi:hypothetical protein
MPLRRGKRAQSKKGIKHNIRTEMHAHPDMKPKQAVAIAYSLAGKAKRKKS